MSVKRIYKNKIFKSILETMKEQAVAGNASAAVENKTNAYFFIEGWCAAKHISRKDIEAIKKEVNQIIFDVFAK